jgi:hypothetical protein
MKSIWSLEFKNVVCKWQFYGLRSNYRSARQWMKLPLPDFWKGKRIRRYDLATAKTPATK